VAIKSFRNKKLVKIFYEGEAKGIRADHHNKLQRILDRLDSSKEPEDMRLPGYALHKLEPKQQGRWAVKVSGNWRVTFEFDDGDAVVVDYEDYH